MGWVLTWCVTMAATLYLEGEMMTPNGPIRGNQRVTVFLKSPLGDGSPVWSDVYKGWVQKGGGTPGSSIPLWSETQWAYFDEGLFYFPVGLDTPLPLHLMSSTTEFWIRVGDVEAPVPHFTIPLSSYASYADRAGWVSANSLTGTLMPSTVTGAYANINRLGLLEGVTLNGLSLRATLTTVTANGYLGINITPLFPLDVSGSIRIRSSGLTFGDGSVMRTAQLISSTANALTGVGSVSIMTTSANASIQFLVDGQTQMVLSSGNLGLGGVTQPQTRLDLDGALRLRSTVGGSLRPGVMVFSGSQFMGYDGSKWVALDMPLAPKVLWKSSSPTQWVASGNRVAIGRSTTDVALQVVGTLNATTIQATTLRGNAAKLSNMPVTSFTTSLPVSKGGIGTTAPLANAIVWGNQSPLGIGYIRLSQGRWLAGGRTGGIAGVVVGDAFLSLLPVSTGWLAQWYPVHDHEMTWQDTMPLGQLTLMSNAHVVSALPMVLKQPWLEQTGGGDFVPMNGGVIRDIQFEAAGQIETQDGRPLVWMPASGQTSIGSYNLPFQTVDVAGGIRLGSSQVSQEGSIRYEAVGGLWGTNDEGDVALGTVPNTWGAMAQNGKQMVVSQNLGIRTSANRTLAVKGSVGVQGGVIGRVGIIGGVIQWPMTVIESARVSAPTFSVIGSSIGLGRRAVSGTGVSIALPAQFGGLLIQDDGIRGEASFISPLTTPTVIPVSNPTVLNPGGAVGFGDVVVEGGLAARSSDLELSVTGTTRLPDATMTAGLEVGNVVVGSGSPLVGIGSVSVLPVAWSVNTDVWIGTRNVLTGTTTRPDVVVAGNVIIGGGIVMAPREGQSLRVSGNVNMMGNMPTIIGGQESNGARLELQLTGTVGQQTGLSFLDSRESVVGSIADNGMWRIGTDSRVAQVMIPAGSVSTPSVYLASSDDVSQVAGGIYRLNPTLNVSVWDGTVAPVILTDYPQVLKGLTLQSVTLSMVTL
ncbi:hypothetical protein EBZ35_05795, partial [bacterium]|nr:hypothetical protein [bacterium]